jgi:small subunit ribosomal protein S6
MRQYEAAYILDPSLEEAEQTQQIERFRGIVEGLGSEVQYVDRWERRRLAYEVKGRREGYYVFMIFKGTPAAEAELTRVLGITDAVIRHMIVRVEESIAERNIAEAKAHAEAKARSQAEAEAAAAAAVAAAPAPAVPAPAAPAAEAPAAAEAEVPAAEAPAAEAPTAEAPAEAEPVAAAATAEETQGENEA